MALDLDAPQPRIADLHSDVDVLVPFSGTAPRGAADRHIGLCGGLHAMVGRPVDLLVRAAVRNPCVRRAIERERRNVCAA